MKDWTGQTYDAVALADPEGGRAQYDANLIRHLDPRVSLNISGIEGGERPAARCLTGFALSADGTCERCGAGPDDACRSSTPGTAGATLGNEPTAPASDPDVALIAGLLRRD